ncbi:MAG: hypothetical protein OXQ32_06840 [bacterium]|nr:hypothetical protein [bacterium]
MTGGVKNPGERLEIEHVALSSYGGERMSLRTGWVVGRLSFSSGVALALPGMGRTIL